LQAAIDLVLGTAGWPVSDFSRSYSAILRHGLAEEPRSARGLASIRPRLWTTPASASKCRDLCRDSIAKPLWALIRGKVRKRSGNACVHTSRCGRPACGDHAFRANGLAVRRSVRQPSEHPGAPPQRLHKQLWRSGRGVIPEDARARSSPGLRDSGRDRP